MQYKDIKKQQLPNNTAYPKGIISVCLRRLLVLHPEDADTSNTNVMQNVAICEQVLQIRL